ADRPASERRKVDVAECDRLNGCLAGGRREEVQQHGGGADVKRVRGVRIHDVHAHLLVGGGAVVERGGGGVDAGGAVVEVQGEGQLDRGHAGRDGDVLVKSVAARVTARQVRVGAAADRNQVGLVEHRL